MSSHLEPEINLIWVSKIRRKEHQEDTYLETPTCPSTCQHAREVQGSGSPASKRAAFCLGVCGVDDVTAFQPPHLLPPWVAGEGGNGHLSYTLTIKLLHTVPRASSNSHMRLAWFPIPVLLKGKLGFPEYNWLALAHRAKCQCLDSNPASMYSWAHVLPTYRGDHSALDPDSCFLISVPLLSTGVN